MLESMKAVELGHPVRRSSDQEQPVRPRPASLGARLPVPTGLLGRRASCSARPSALGSRSVDPSCHSGFPGRCSVLAWFLAAAETRYLGVVLEERKIAKRAGGREFTMQKWKGED